MQMYRETTSRIFNRDFLLLWQGHFVSQVGTQVGFIGLIFWMKHTTSMASMVGFAGMAFALTATFLTPLGGTLSDIFSRKKIIVTCDVISGLITILLAVLLFTGITSIWFTCALMIGMQLLLGATSSFFNPAVFGAIPELVPENKLVQANSIKSCSEQLAVFIGFGAGGFLFTILGAPLMLLLNGISYLLSAFSELFIRIPNLHLKLHKSEHKTTIRKYLNNTWDGFNYIRHQKGLKQMVLVFALMNFFAAPFWILLPFFVEDQLGLGAEWYGILMAVFGAGAFTGYVAAGTVKIKPELRGQVSIFILMAEAVLASGFGFCTSVSQAIILAVLIGILHGYFTVVFETAIQLKTPGEFRGRVFGIIGTITGGIVPLGMMLAGIIADLSGKQIHLIFFVAGICIFLCSFFLVGNKDAKEILKY